MEPITAINPDESFAEMIHKKNAAKKIGDLQTVQKYENRIADLEKSARAGQCIRIM